ncbi:MAG: lamin tail domain-containing protein, partial [Bacteroidales bacterium]|nr:lamin tail domain-containing protein [Bacteroidales bacterium]
MKKNYPFMLQVLTFLMVAILITTEAKAQLYINEFMASNDMAFPGPQGDHPDWIEIYNAGTEAVMLGGYYLSDDLTDPTKMFQISSEFPDSVTISAGGYLLFYANSDPDWSVLNLNFKLGGSGEAIGFWSPDQVFVDSLTYGEQIADVSFGRYEDGTNNWFAMTNYTPGAANQNPAPAPIVLYINEFMASNDAAFPGPQGDYPDWIEIYNAGTEDVMLGGYYLSDDLVDPAKMFQIPATYPDSVTVPAGGYLVFYANSDPDWSVLNLNFKLGGSGEQIG